MSTLLNLKTTLQNLKTAVTEIEKEITTEDEAYPYGWHQGDKHYWTNSFAGVTPLRISADQYLFTYTIQAVYHLRKATAGIDGEVEEGASLLMAHAAMVFASKTKLECASFPRGVPGITGEGVNTDVSLSLYGPEGAQKRVVLATLAVPITTIVNRGRN